MDTAAPGLRRAQIPHLLPSTAYGGRDAEDSQVVALKRLEHWQAEREIMSPSLWKEMYYKGGMLYDMHGCGGKLRLRLHTHRDASH